MDITQAFFPSISSSNWIVHFWKVPPIHIGPMVLGNMETGLSTQNLVAILVVVQWPFATFLMSPMARNRFFSTTDFPYFALPTSPTVNHLFVRWEQTPLEFWRNMGLGFLFSVMSMWAGIYWGGWLKKVRR